MGTYSTGMMKNNWAVTASLSMRWSEHGYEKGTFYNANSLFLSVEKKINDRNSINFTALDAIYKRGVAGGTTQEVYDLMNDNFYNPYWGYQNGEVRNSRVRSNNKPLFTLAHFWKPSEKLDVQTTVGYWFGKSGYTALNWYDVTDPRPDYYKKLPSYYTDSTDIARITEAWQTDPSVSHVDWESFYFANGKNIILSSMKEESPAIMFQETDRNILLKTAVMTLSQFQFNTRASWDLSERINFTGGCL